LYRTWLRFCFSGIPFDFGHTLYFFNLHYLYEGKLFCLPDSPASSDFSLFLREMRDLNRDGYHLLFLVNQN